MNFYDETSTKLNEEDKNTCEGHLTEYECANALKYMKNNKSPGSDGITTEFYKIFWNILKLYLIKSLNSAYTDGHLSEIQSQSLITLLPKPEKDTMYLKNWRPISLLNIDYKIASKAIANRIKSVLPKIITQSQTGFMKGRYIGENIRILEEVLDYVEHTNSSCLLFFSDFEKAFDSVDHTFLVNTLKQFNFGDSLIKWVKTFYNNITSSVLNNGFMTDFFNIERGVRQGCPLSPYLFILAIEPLSQYISKCTHIKGIQMGNIEVKSTLFADDATFVMDGSEESFTNLINILDQFERISGLKLNNSKCQVLKAGSQKQNNNVYLKHKCFQWSSNTGKALGITFTTNRLHTLKINLDPKINEFKTCLKQWQHRKLTLLGKITVIKTYALPKLIYPLTVLQNPTPDTIKLIQNIANKFLWDEKPAKIKKQTITQKYEYGGLKMIDVEKFIYSLKGSWIKRLIEANPNNPLRKIYYQTFDKYGGNLIFESNVYKHDIEKIFLNKPFLKDILISWRNINAYIFDKITSKTVIWNNSLLRSDDKTIFYSSWLAKGVKYLEDVFDKRTNKFYTFEFAQFVYGITDKECLKYQMLIHSIPKTCKRKYM